MAEMTKDRRSLVLRDGAVIPMLGLGVWQASDGAECVNAVRWALELGYRHVDTAQVYENEDSVGKALRESGVPREDLFIATKFSPREQDPVAEAEKSLRRLGLDYVDLYLVHWPQGGPTWAWPGMERTRELGYARSIGISNFNGPEMEELSSCATVPPAVNQLQISPFKRRSYLLDVCARHGIAVEAYSPLGTGRHLANETVERVARRARRSAAQVLIRWCLQMGLVVIPKSANRGRIAENAQAFDFDLSEQDMVELGSFDEVGDPNSVHDKPWW